MENTQNTIMETIISRRSIRRFDNKQLLEEDLQQILQAGLYCLCRPIWTGNPS